jgi:periplasmic divalent cation tolerance protein
LHRPGGAGEPRAAVLPAGGGALEAARREERQGDDDEAQHQQTIATKTWTDNPRWSILPLMCMESSDYIAVFVTCPGDKAAELAGALVKGRYAACANIVPTVRSIYTWKGEICDDAEALMVIKTRTALFEALREKVVELHPYDVPEVIALPITASHAPYLAWVDESTGSGQ